MAGSEWALPTAACIADVTSCLDALVAAARAHRGLVVVRAPEGLLVLVARSDRGTDLSLRSRYLRSACDQAFSEGRRVVVVDQDHRSVYVTGGGLDSLASPLVLVECTPVKRGDATLAVVYLESSAAEPPPGESAHVRPAFDALAAALTRIDPNRA